MHFQLQQFLILSVLFLIGKITAYIYLSWLDMVLILLSTFMIEHFLIYLKSKVLNYISFSSLSTALGVMLMFSSPHGWIYIFIIALGLIQKHFLILNYKHLFNPSNFALIVGLVIFYHDAHLVLGQLGDERWLQGLVIVLAISILSRVQRWLIPLAFVATYLVFQYLFIILSDPMLIMDDILQRFYSVSFILFILFMLTDPKTTPQRWERQILFALFISLFSTGLDYFYGFRVQHLFISLFFLSFLYMALEYVKECLITKIEILKLFLLLVLVLSAIIYIELQVPYYLEMNS